MEESILISVKKILGIDKSYTAYDLDIITHINTVFLTLQQLGIGPVGGFMIEDDGAEWPEFIGSSTNLNAVKSYVYLRVRMMFDPPATSFHINAVEEQIKEIEWRLSQHREEGVPWPAPMSL